MSTNRTKQAQARQQFAEIRSYITFNYDLRKKLHSSQIKKIAKYHHEIANLKKAQVQVFRPRLKKHLRTAQAFSQYSKPLPGIKVAFIPNYGEGKLKISFTTKGELRTKGAGILTSGIDFRPHLADLIENPKHLVEKLINGRPETSYTIRAGERGEILKPASPERIGYQVERYCARYPELNEDGSRNNHWFAHWMFGLNGYTFTDQEDPAQYMQAKKEAREARNHERYLKYRRERCTRTHNGRRCTLKQNHEGQHRYAKPRDSA